jgi:hypothetical protein
MNSLGLNGSSRNDAADAAFRASPSYQYDLGQALQGVLRNGAATGNVASGNVLQALQDRGHSLADQQYGNWQTQLSGLDPFRDIQGQAGLYGEQATLASNTGVRKAG